MWAKAGIRGNDNIDLAKTNRDSRVGLDETSRPTRRVIPTVSGANIGYGSTSECLVQCGLVILQEQDKLPNAGGVFSPGYAFAETSLTERLTEKGVTFRTVVQEIN